MSGTVELKILQEAALYRIARRRSPMSPSMRRRHRHHRHLAL